MTRDNSKRLYDHYVEIGYSKAAKDMLKKYPDFEAHKAVKKVVKKQEEEQKD